MMSRIVALPWSRPNIYDRPLAQSRDIPSLRTRHFDETSTSLSTTHTRLRSCLYPRTIDPAVASFRNTSSFTRTSTEGGLAVPVSSIHAPPWPPLRHLTRCQSAPHCAVGISPRPPADRAQHL
eukprot:TRINITY_DN1805_c0_g2_i1.p2 TRINITY_DN1805_c0_g2~~TRINITY_DN1805_c0_g2_i1.p2  ORF type:complete len:123 (-),score=1.59 TRINITY_DN1805_c0_g2_i1:7-375(-)